VEQKLSEQILNWKDRIEQLQNEMFAVVRREDPDENRGMRLIDGLRRAADDLGNAVVNMGSTVLSVGGIQKVDETMDVARRAWAELGERERLFELALQRPPGFASMSAEVQWAVDKELGILDWDGYCPHDREVMSCNDCRTRYLKSQGSSTSA
jgi:hypothetical protein